MGRPVTTPDAERLVPQEIEKLEALLEKAIRAPWIAERLAIHGLSWIRAGELDSISLAVNNDDAALIVALVNAAPSLLHSARVLQGLKEMASTLSNEPGEIESAWPELCDALAEAERRAAPLGVMGGK